MGLNALAHSVMESDRGENARKSGKVKETEEIKEKELDAGETKWLSIGYFVVSDFVATIP